jgi:bifunctional ADP-heptose synthase (sugar kinase/adenylyltransferase)
VDQETILIVGDLLIDRTFYVDVTKLSPEAPVPVAMLTGRSHNTPGGAGLAAAFAAKNSIPSIFCTYTSSHIADNLENSYGINVLYTGPYDTVVNAIKTRYIDNERHYHLLRVDSDRVTPKPFAKYDEEEEWFDNIRRAIVLGTITSLVLLDYCKGIFTKNRAQRLISIANAMKVPVYVDSRSPDLETFYGADIIKLNSAELHAAESRYNCSIWDICDKLNLKYLIETRGKDGAQCVHKNNVVESYQPDINIFEGSPDVTGCGDVFDISFCYYWSIEKLEIGKAMIEAVNQATNFAYEPIQRRL